MRMCTLKTLVLTNKQENVESLTAKIVFLFTSGFGNIYFRLGFPENGESPS